MVSECSSLSIGMPASVVVGVGWVSVICHAFRVWVGQLGGLPDGRRRMNWRPLLVHFRHREQAAIENFGDPDDEASYDATHATHVPSLRLTDAAVSAASPVAARLRVPDCPSRDAAP